MKNKEVSEQLKNVMGMNLQFFAEGDGSGADDGSGAGTGEGEEGTTGDDDSAAGGDTKSFDDLLKTADYQSEFDRRVNQAVNTALTKQKIKYEALMDDKLSEADKLSKMNKEEKKEYLAKKQEKELEDREAAVTRRELAAEAKNTLAEKKLPVALAAILDYKDAETCKQSIETVEKAFQEAVSAAVEEKLKGGAPLKKGLSDTNTQLDEIMKNMSE